MKKQRETIIMRQVLPFALILIFAAALLPFFIVSLFNHPAPWDDYSVALLVKERGYWGFYSHFLQHWNGRYVSTLLQGLNPLAFDSFDTFRFVPMVFLGGFIAGCCYFMRRLWANRLPMRRIGVIALGYCAIFFAYVRSAVELWYWHSSSVVYATAFIAVWFLLGLAAPLLQGAYLNAKEQTLACLLGLLLPGISESVAISMLAFAGIVALLRLRQPTDLQPRKAFMQWFAVAFCIGLGLLIFASFGGTQARLAVHSESFQWQRAVKGMLMQLPIFASWAINSTLWIFTLLCVPLFARLTHRLPATHFLRLPPLLMAALTAAVIFAAVFPYYWVTGFLYIFVRIENIAFFWFLFFWFANVACWVGYVQRRVQRRVQRCVQLQWGKMPAYAVVVLLAIGCLKLYSPNTKVGVAWLTLLNGDAAKYDKDHQERYRRIAAHKKAHPQDTLLLPPIDTHMELLMFEELTENPGHQIANKDFAKYFGIHAVKVQ
jgi:hypothetical protein